MEASEHVRGVAWHAFRVSHQDRINAIGRESCVERFHFREVGKHQFVVLYRTGDNFAEVGLVMCTGHDRDECASRPLSKDLGLLRLANVREPDPLPLVTCQRITVWPLRARQPG